MATNPASREGQFDWIWPAVEKAGLPVALLAGNFLDKFRWIAERHPNLTLIIDHCGLRSGAKDEAALEAFRKGCCCWRSCRTWP